MPLQIGARDVAFPRINAFGYWCYLFGGILLNTRVGSSAAAPTAAGSTTRRTPASCSRRRHGIDFWTVGLLITGIASLTGAVNLIVTVLNMRAPGMTLMKLPIFTWMTLVTQFLLLFAIPVLTAAQFLLLIDRLFGANFFDASKGADPLLWQHLFWIFGHPEVYIMILPAFGHRLGDHPGLRPQAALRLPVHGLLGHRHRLHGLGRVGPPHVRLRASGPSRSLRSR